MKMKLIVSSGKKTKPWSFQGVLDLVALSIQDDLHVCFKNSQHFWVYGNLLLLCSSSDHDARCLGNQAQALKNIFMKVLGGENQNVAIKN